MPQLINTSAQLTKEKTHPQKPTQISVEFAGESALEEGLLENDHLRLLNGHPPKVAPGDPDEKVDDVAA